MKYNMKQCELKLYNVKPGELKLYNVKPDELTLVYDVKSSYMM